MISYKINAKNVKKNTTVDFELKRDGPEEDFYFEGENNEKINPQEIPDTSRREICNNLMLANSPIFVLKPGKSCDFKTMTYAGTITCE